MDTKQTKYMIVTRQPQQQTIRINNDEIQRVNNYKNLETMINEESGQEVQKPNRTTKATFIKT